MGTIITVGHYKTNCHSTKHRIRLQGREYAVMWVRQFSRDRDRGSTDEVEVRQLRIRPRRGRGEAEARQSENQENVLNS